MPEPARVFFFCLSNQLMMIGVIVPSTFGRDLFKGLLHDRGENRFFGFKRRVFSVVRNYHGECGCFDLVLILIDEFAFFNSF